MKCPSLCICSWGYGWRIEFTLHFDIIASPLVLVPFPVFHMADHCIFHLNSYCPISNNYKLWKDFLDGWHSLQMMDWLFIRGFLTFHTRVRSWKQRLINFKAVFYMNHEWRCMEGCDLSSLYLSLLWPFDENWRVTIITLWKSQDKLYRSHRHFIHFKDSIVKDDCSKTWNIGCQDGWRLCKWSIQIAGE